MATYTFRFPGRDAGKTITVYDATSTQVASGAADANGTFTVSLASGDYYAMAPDGQYRRGDSDAPQSVESAALSGSQYAPKLAAFHAALAKRTTAPVDILCVGDSVTEGLYATKMENRWVARLRETLRSRFPTGVAGGTGYVPTYLANGTYTDNPVTVSGSTSTGSDYGLGRRYRALGGAGQAVTITFTGTALDFYYVRYSSGGTVNVVVDGGGSTPVSTSGSGPTGGVRYQITGLTAGSHTVSFTYASGGVVFTEGFMVYNGDEAKGIRVWEGGHSSYSASHFVDPSFSHWIDVVSTIQPDLVVIELGINDWQANATKAQFKTNLQTLITNIRAKCTVAPPFVLFMPWQAQVGVTPTYPWTDYIAGMEEVAAADSQVVTFDAWQRFSQRGAAGTNIFLDTDKVHPNDSGHGFIADSLAGFLTPR